MTVPVPEPKPVPMPVYVAPMTVSDVPAVRLLEQSAFAFTWQPEAFENELRNNPAAHYLTLRDEEELLGYAGFWLVADEAHVTSVAIVSGRRGGGLGTRLFHALVGRAAEHGARWMTLEVQHDNQPAQKLYRRFGFARVGIRPRYYEGKHDAWIMWAGNLQSDTYRRRLAEIGVGLAS